MSMYLKVDTLLVGKGKTGKREVREKERERERERIPL